MNEMDFVWNRTNFCESLSFCLFRYFIDLHSIPTLADVVQQVHDQPDHWMRCVRWLSRVSSQPPGAPGSHGEALQPGWGWSLTVPFAVLVSCTFSLWSWNKLKTSQGTFSGFRKQQPALEAVLPWMFLATGLLVWTCFIWPRVWSSDHNVSLGVCHHFCCAHRCFMIHDVSICQ